ncbi:MAG: hypothetical protein HQM04_01515 [Magnetococcales bacterium]|nr:hypothetical protein [Magnetococcales bacterium]MBF0113698.1 hypothetical protein [Magnetococcales bacterium]
MMHRALEHWKNVQLYLWLLFFGHLIANGQEEYYLAALQSDLLYAGGGVLLLLIIVGVLPNSALDVSPLGWRVHLQLALESLGHAIPLLLLFLAGVTSLNMSTATLRDGIQMRILDPNQATREVGDVLAALSPGEHLEVTHLQLYGNPRLQEGAPVVLIGRLSRLQGERLREFFPEWSDRSVVLLYRFAIACCAADASPVAVVLEQLPNSPEVKEEEWYEVRGTTRSMPGEQRLLAVRVERIEAIPPPKRPYLSWLDGY